MAKYFFRFGDPDRATRALAEPRRWLRTPLHVYNSTAHPHVMVPDCTAEDALRMRDEAAVFPDIEFDIATGTRTREYWSTLGAPAAATLDTTSLRDVLDRINAPLAWPASAGKG